jgi:enhancing lycopene biosynthesis protein 2
MPKVGVVLSGCGVMDGSEIHEAVATLLALDRAGAEVLCMAPNVPQMHVVNHVTGEPTGETRNVLEESARIARGNIEDIARVRAEQLDALVFPGGYGAAKNLCDFATKGTDCSVQPEVERLVLEMYEARKPIGAICIAPALIARILGRKAEGLELTIGKDPDTAAKLEAMGARHVPKEVHEVHVDEKNRVVTTPAYMLAQRIGEAAEGIERLVQEVLRLAG